MNLSLRAKAEVAGSSRLPVSGLRSLVASVAALVIGLCSAGSSDGALIGLYEFNGNFENSLTSPGMLGSLEADPAGGTTGFSSGSWSWSEITAPGPKLKANFSEPLPAYSIGMIFEISEVTSYSKLLHLSEELDGQGRLSDDSGLYAHSGQLQIYPDSNHVGTLFPATTVSIVVTRESNGFVTLYQNGTLLHSKENAEGFDINSFVYFFTDDDGIRSGTEFSSSGRVSEIRIWNTALSASEVADAFQPIPEPSTVMLTAAAGALALLTARHRRARASNHS